MFWIGELLPLEAMIQVLLTGRKGGLDLSNAGKGDLSIGNRCP